MAPIFSDFRRVRKRVKRTMNYGRKEPQNLNRALTELIVNYFDAHSPYDYMNLESSSNISRVGFADPCTMVVAMVYLDRLRLKDKAFFESSDPTDLYLPALILASKFLHDSDTIDRATNSEWAEALEISDNHLNELEWSFVKSLDWDVNVKKEQFESCLSQIESWVSSDFVKKNGFCTYNELNVLTNGSESLKYQELLKDFLTIIGMATIVYTVSIMAIFTTSVALTCIPQNSQIHINRGDTRNDITFDSYGLGENCPAAIRNFMSGNLTLGYCREDLKTEESNRFGYGSVKAVNFEKDIIHLENELLNPSAYALLNFVYS